ncbi:MAG: DUF2062 domain-containing protein [Proteobacteria bacterium]|nr:DUF2062 domain-containing protein [Pseudomonadota bacterium]
MAPFRHLLHDHRLWGIRRKTVIPAFALGLFIAFQPFPGHVLAAVLAALVLHINIPVASLTTFISNPVTIGPVFYFSYRVGAFLLSIEPGPFAMEMSLEWLTNTFVSIWQPLLLGSVLIGTIAATLGYVVLDVVWRGSLADYKARKRRKRKP